jgi:cytochrome d ubiquinol oxidase subunit I
MIPYVYFIALVFGIHIVVVNLGIALSTIIPLLKRKADLSGNKELDEIARGIFRIYAATYAIAGVMGTAFTVFLLSFYPEFIGVAGNITLLPFGIAIVSILVHFLAIVLYYYGWDSFPRWAHFSSGILLALTAYTIPLGFRLVFAFLNTPSGLKIDDKPYIDAFGALANPTFMPLYLKSIFGAVTFGSLFISSLLAYQITRRKSEEDLQIYSTFLRIAIIGIFIMLILGPWYSMSLISTPVKFNNIFRSFGWGLSGIETINMGWLFVIKIILIAIQIYAILKLTVFGNGVNFRLSAIATTSAALTVLTGEYLNMFSQYPYFLANLPIVAESIPEPWRTILGRSLSLENVSPLAKDPTMLLVSAIGIAILLAAIGYFIYETLYKGD